MQQLSGAPSPLVRVPTATTGVIVLYNPLAHNRTTVVTVPFVRPAATATSQWPTVRDHRGAAVQAQLSPNDEVNDVDGGAEAYKDVVSFVATTVPALGFASYTLHFDGAGGEPPTTHEPTVVVGPPERLTNGALSVGFDQQSGLMSSITSASGAVAARQTFHEYSEGEGGAYCLVMTGEARRVAPPYNISHVQGPVFSQVTTSYRSNGGMQQWVRLFHGADEAVVEVEHHVGTLFPGREMVSRLETDLRPAGGALLTDDSGFPEMHSRARNQSAPISHNFHSMVQSSALSDGARELAVLTRRTMGVASLASGELEYMLARRLTTSSDSQGPWPLDEREDIRDTVWLAVGSVLEVEAARASRAFELEHAVMPFFTEGTAPPPTPLLAPATSLQPWVFVDMFVRHDAARATGAPEFAVRLQSVAKDAPPTEVRLRDLGLGAAGDTCVETTLSMQQPRATNDAQRLRWDANDTAIAAGERARAADVAACSADATITLNPLDIRAFVLSAK